MNVSRDFDGIIDEVRIWDEALPDANITAMYNADVTAAAAAAPWPDPMTWSAKPFTSAATSITMIAATADDPCDVEYYFDETTGNSGADDSGWQTSTSYTDTGLTAGVTYTYTVKARDKDGNNVETTASSAHSVDSGEPAIWYKLDDDYTAEAGGAKVTDSGSQGWHGILIGYQYYWDGGYIDGCLYGPNWYMWIEGNYNRNLDYSNGVTVCAWIEPLYFEAAVSDDVIVSTLEDMHDDVEKGWAFQYGDAGKLNFSWGDGSTVDSVSTNRNTLVVNTWQHVAVTYDNSTVKLFKDGVKKKTTSNSSGITQPTQGMNVGMAKYEDYKGFIYGKFDSVRVYPAALSEAEITAIYDDEVAARVSTAPWPNPMKWATEPNELGYCHH